MPYLELGDAGTRSKMAKYEANLDDIAFNDDGEVVVLNTNGLMYHCGEACPSGGFHVPKYLLYNLRFGTYRGIYLEEEDSINGSFL